MMKSSMKNMGNGAEHYQGWKAGNLSFAHHYSPVGIVVGIHLLNEKAILCEI